MDRSRFNPFPGLRPFESSEAHLFFGREGQSTELVRLLREHRFVAVVGTSGSGKSSLVRAGLLPSLHAGFMPAAGSTWRVALLRPGSDPIGNLAGALSGPEVLDPEGVDDPFQRAQIEATLRRGALGLGEVVADARLPADENVLVVVDQFEEIFRYQRVAGDQDFGEDAAAFVKLLLEASAQREVPLYVLLTMRSDYLGDCAHFRGLPEAVNRGQYLIPRMTRRQRREAIVGPVAVGGGTIAPRLVNRLLNDAGDEPDQLPIVQHALMRTWDRWEQDHGEGEPLDLRHYAAIGGMAEALSRHADEAFRELPDDRSRSAAEKIFRRLTERGPDNREIRRPTRVAELSAVAGVGEERVREVVEVFRRPGRSFLMPPADVPLQPDTLIDISHESLIRGWERLRGWVEEEADSARTYRRLTETAVLYGQGRAGLWHDPDLQIALGWWERDRPNEAWARRYDPHFDQAAGFLEESRRARDAEVQKRRRRTRFTFAGLGAGLLVTTTLAGFAALQWSEAGRNAQEAERQRGIAESKAEEAERQRGIAESKTEEAERHVVQLDRQADSLRTATRTALLALNFAEDQRRQAEQERERAEQAERWALEEALRARQTYFTASSGAVNLADRVIQRLPPMAAASLHHTKALNLSAMGKDSEAVEEYTRALESGPDFIDVRVNRSDGWLNLGEPDSALTDLEHALALGSRDFLLHTNRALALSQLKRYDEAEAAYREADESTDFNVYETTQAKVSPAIERATRRKSLALPVTEVKTALQYGRANVFAFDGRREFLDVLDGIGDRVGQTPILNAINWTWLHRESVPQDYGAFAAEGALWERAGSRFKGEAVRAYGDFRREHGNHRDPRYAWLAGWVDTRLSRLQPERLTEREGADVALLKLEADEFQVRGFPDSAAMRLTQAIDLEPTRTDLYISRAELRLAQAIDLHWGEQRDSVAARPYYQLARSDCEKVLEMSPRFARAHYCMARVDYEKATWEDLENPAIVGPIREKLKLAVDYDPSWGWSYVIGARALQRIDPGVSSEALQRGLQVDDGLVSAHLYAELAEYQLQAKRLPEARASAETAIRFDGSNLKHHNLLSSIDSVAGSPPAEVALQKAAGYVEAGDIRSWMGKMWDAADAYFQALRILLVEDVGAAASGTTREALDKLTTLVVDAMGGSSEAARFYRGLDFEGLAVEEEIRPQLRALLEEEARRLEAAGPAPRAMGDSGQR
ncbi:MAG: hypothetical protein KY397_02745 [Gemmatimonadetes bacterium]|nr:hypothetical protein [Gemmatimonadota bacterium]